MANFYIKADGLDKLLKKLETKSQTVREEVYAEVEGTAYDVAASAANKVPKDMSFLSNAITVNPIDEKTFEVVAQKFYAPYVEFGTGANAANYLATKDPELQAYAMQFYVNGQGRMPARPFFFPAYEAETKKMIERIKAIIQR